ncbi:hypothetical protein B0H13DRAFT_2346538 [Mycena leptocephala]|nr:hypothetical protein B0H13DRAFT_2346538 [Mycena leptocephala]
MRGGAKTFTHRSFADKDQQLVNTKRDKDAVNAAKAAATKQRLAKIAINLDRAKIVKLTNDDLRDQLAIYRDRGDKEVPMKSKLPRKPELLAAVLAALDSFEASQSPTNS